MNTVGTKRDPRVGFQTKNLRARSDSVQTGFEILFTFYNIEKTEHIDIEKTEQTFWTAL